MHEMDRDDVIAIVAHMSRITARHKSEPRNVAIDLFVPMAAGICRALGLDDEDIGRSSIEQARAMARVS